MATNYPFLTIFTWDFCGVLWEHIRISFLFVIHISNTPIQIIINTTRPQITIQPNIIHPIKPSIYLTLSFILSPLKTNFGKEDRKINPVENLKARKTYRIKCSNYHSNTPLKSATITEYKLSLSLSQMLLLILSSYHFPFR